MKLDQETIKWVESALDEAYYGEVGLIFHVRNGKIEWMEKIRRESKKVVDRNSSVKDNTHRTKKNG